MTIISTEYIVIHVHVNLKQFKFCRGGGGGEGDGVWTPPDPFRYVQVKRLEIVTAKLIVFRSIVELYCGPVVQWLQKLGQ